jgi:hypothetical protein
MDHFDRHYRAIERQFYPRGIPATGNVENAHYRITVAVLSALKEQGAFTGDVLTAARSFERAEGSYRLVTTWESFSKLA